VKQETDLNEERFILERLKWLIFIRWFTVLFIVAATLTAINIFNVALLSLHIYLVALFIAAYNAGFKLYIQYLPEGNHPTGIKRLAVVQGMLDIISLTILIHFTGGIENPFIFYFIFHTILTGMLLPGKGSYIQAGIISSMVAGLFISEYLGVMQHHPIKGFLDIGIYKNPTYIVAITFVFTSTIFIATFFTVSVAEKVKRREKELAENRKELQEANLKLLEKDRLKDEYVTMVSHDLKTPLASIQSLIEVLMGGFAGQVVDEKIKEILQRIQRKIEFLHHYTKDLLDLSRIRSAKQLNIEELDIKEVIDTAVEIVLPKKEEKDLEVSIEIDDKLPHIKADKELMIYVFMNLIANAFKYTASGGKVWIKVSQTGGLMTAEVKDTGIGIPPGDIPHIFEEFYRASNVVKTTKGTGLGLSLVRHIIERHSGTISIESEQGKGSAFRFTMPIRMED